MKRYGLPTQVLSDNGTCFTGRLIGGEVEFERRLHGLGIATIHSRPYHPQTCGKLERFHRTMKEWLAERSRATSIEQLQELLDSFRIYYNESRPHQGIDDDTPAERYVTESRPSEVTLTASTPSITHPPRSILRKVSRCGNLSFGNFQIQVGSEWNLCTLRIAIISGVVHIYYGEQLVRALQLDPSQNYYPIGRGRDRIVPSKGGATPIL
jgi:hypothetical protein